jgi:hypothetical protein
MQLPLYGSADASSPLSCRLMMGEPRCVLKSESRVTVEGSETILWNRNHPREQLYPLSPSPLFNLDILGETFPTYLCTTETRSEKKTRRTSIVSPRSVEKLFPADRTERKLTPYWSSMAHIRHKQKQPPPYRNSSRALSSRPPGEVVGGKASTPRYYNPADLQKIPPPTCTDRRLSNRPAPSTGCNPILIADIECW